MKDLESIYQEYKIIFSIFEKSIKLYQAYDPNWRPLCQITKNKCEENCPVIVYCGQAQKLYQELIRIKRDD